MLHYYLNTQGTKRWVLEWTNKEGCINVYYAYTRGECEDLRGYLKEWTNPSVYKEDI